MQYRMYSHGKSIRGIQHLVFHLTDMYREYAQVCLSRDISEGMQVTCSG